jgi:hypothetical protein
MESAARRGAINIVNENGKLTWKALCERKGGLVAGTRVALQSGKKYFS